MLNNYFIRQIVYLASLVTSIQASASEFVVVGYLPEHRVADVDTDRLVGVTDVIYFGIQPPGDGDLADVRLEPSVLKKLHDINRATKCRLLVCIGGWGRSEGFPALASDKEVRQRFVAGLLKLCQRHGFDGVDFDWEHPRNADELANYARLLSETKTAFQEPALLVTVAQAAWQDLGEAAYATVDRVHLMSYDHEFPQATLAKTKADVERLIGWKCPPHKIAVGIPFYGRNKANEPRSYRELIGSQVPDARVDMLNGYAFNGRTTVAAKIDMALKAKLGGVMIWELGHDADSKDASLLNEIHHQLQRRRARE